MNDIKTLFFELIRVSIGVSECLSKPPTNEDWKALYDMAKKQSLVGVCFAGVQKLVNQRQEPPEMIYLTWMGMAAKIQQRNEVMNQRCVELQTKLRKDGFPNCILKGQGVGDLYGSLSILRQSGDIDVWIDADRDKVIDYVKRICPNDDVDISGKHIEFCLFDDIIVEAHFMPASTRVPIIGSRVKSFYDGVKIKQMVHKIALCSGQEITAPTKTFQAIHILHHAFGHFLFEGIGMRHLMDYYFVLQQPFTHDEQEFVIATLKHLGLWRFARGVAYICRKINGANECFIPADEDLGKRILSSVLNEGNFGKFDKRKDDSKMDSSWYRYWYHNVRLIKLFDIAPWFIVMSPFSRIYEYLWRFSHGYFKKKDADIQSTKQLYIMKHIHISQSHPMSGGGVGSVITDLCEAMIKETKEVYVISLFQKSEDEQKRENEWSKKHGINIMLMQEDSAMGTVAILKRLRKTLKELAKDDECCLYLHLKWGMLAGLVSSLGLKNIRRVEVYHSGYMNYKLQAFVSKPFTHHYLSVSKEAKQQLINWFGVDGRKVTVAYNGVDIEHIRELGAKTVSFEGDLNFMSVGRLSFEKGFLQSIEAFGDMKEAGELKGATYTMIGNGPQMEESKEKAKGHVNFTGLIPRDSVYSNIAGCDVMVLPSWWEGNSILLLEVLAIGKAMIVSDIPSFREVLNYKPLADDEVCRLEPFGAVFRAKDTESCKAAMRLIEANKEKLGDMASFVGGLADTFSIKNQVKIYKSVAEKVFEK